MQVVVTVTLSVLEMMGVVMMMVTLMVVVVIDMTVMTVDVVTVIDAWTVGEEIWNTRWHCKMVRLGEPRQSRTSQSKSSYSKHNRV